MLLFHHPSSLFFGFTSHIRKYLSTSCYNCFFAISCFETRTAIWHYDKPNRADRWNLDIIFYYKHTCNKKMARLSYIQLWERLKTRTSYFQWQNHLLCFKTDFFNYLSFSISDCMDNWIFCEPREVRFCMHFRIESEWQQYTAPSIQKRMRKKHKNELQYTNCNQVNHQTYKEEVSSEKIIENWWSRNVTFKLKVLQWIRKNLFHVVNLLTIIQIT